MIDLLKILGLMLVPVAVGILVWIVVKFWRLLRSLEGAHDPDELHDKGRCGECGYDLRSGHLVCPECGTPVPTQEERAAARGTQLNPIALRDDWAEASKLPRTPSPLELPTVVFSTVNNLEANLLVDQLNDRGVWHLSVGRKSTKSELPSNESTTCTSSCRRETSFWPNPSLIASAGNQLPYKHRRMRHGSERLISMLNTETFEQLKEQLGSKRVWGVATDSQTNNFHEHLTLTEAIDTARQESEREAGRNAWVVLVVKHLHGPPL